VTTLGRTVYTCSKEYRDTDRKAGNEWGRPTIRRVTGCQVRAEAVLPAGMASGATPQVHTVRGIGYLLTETTG
jgi:hypothetical protein